MKSTVTDYPNILAAAQGLLGEAVQIANESGLAFAVVGGWAPFLRNSRPVEHPGTKDVDLLFEKGAEPGALQHVVGEFLGAGYIPSAKHEFQILRELRVAGRAFIFNVDLLHPAESSRNPELFVDHLELPVPSSEFRSDSYFLKSIMIPDAAFIFEGHASQFEVDCELPMGQTVTSAVPLISEAALIITKCDSCKSAKRQRDAFDIFLTVVQSHDYDGLVQSFLSLKENHRDVYNSIYAVIETLQTKHIFARNVMRFLPKPIPNVSLSAMEAFEAKGAEETMVSTIEDQMRRFFHDIQLDEKASLDGKSFAG